MSNTISRKQKIGTTTTTIIAVSRRRNDTTKVAKSEDYARARRFTLPPASVGQGRDGKRVKKNLQMRSG